MEIFFSHQTYNTTAKNNNNDDDDSVNTVTILDHCFDIFMTSLHANFSVVLVLEGKLVYPWEC